MNIVCYNVPADRSYLTSGKEYAVSKRAMGDDYIKADCGTMVAVTLDAPCAQLMGGVWSEVGKEKARSPETCTITVNGTAVEAVLGSFKYSASATPNDSISAGDTIVKAPEAVETTLTFSDEPSREEMDDFVKNGRKYIETAKLNVKGSCEVDLNKETGMINVKMTVPIVTSLKKDEPFDTEAWLLEKALEILS